MAEEKKTEKSRKEEKATIEREYIVPLRKEWLKVPKYRRAKKASKALKEFIARHMKVYDRDLRKIKVDAYLNNELFFRGMRKPAAKIRVKAIKYENGEVAVKLVELPKHIEFEIARKARKQAEKIREEIQPSKEEIKEKQEAEKKNEEKSKQEKEEIKEETKEKQESSKIASEKIEKDLAKQAKHTSRKDKPIIHRKTMQK